MPEEKSDLRLERAIEEFQQYLSDLVPPLVVADSVHLLIDYPEITAANIYSWANGQLRTSRAATMTDYLFHAMKKIHIMGEYHLLGKDVLFVFLKRLKPLILSYCPATDRAMLAENLEHLDDISSQPSSSVEVIYRQGGSVQQTPVRAAEAPVVDAEIQRLSLLVSKLERELKNLGMHEGGVDPDRKRREVVSEALAQAARSARVSDELDRALDKLRHVGVQAGMDDVFRALGSQIPEWSLAIKPGIELPEDSNLKAMRRMVTQAPDPKEGAVRFNHMIRTAMERFNEGHLQQAGSMIEIAEQIVAAKEVQESVTESIRIRGHEDLDQDRLRKYAESAENYGPLRKVMNFFKGLNTQSLLELLHAEPRREKRRLILLLLEAHGDTARRALLQALHVPLSSHPTSDEIYLRRNVLYLMRRIPASQDEKEEELNSLVSRDATMASPLIVLKEAIAYLGQLKGKTAEATLISLFQDLESLVLSDRSPFDSQESLFLLDRVSGSLARIGTPEAHKALIDHAFKKKAKLGDTMGRLAELSGQDFSSDPASLEKLLQGLKESMPKKLLGLVLQERDHDIESIVKAISGTTSPAGRSILKEIANKFPDRPSGQAAAKALAAAAAAPAPAKRAQETVASSLSGDLDFFALPALFQSLSDNAVNGTLTLRDRDNAIFAKVDFDQGKFSSIETDHLKGDSALYQLIERPRPGTFQFMRVSEAAGSVESKDVLPLILEAVRRYDELRESDAIIPDDARLTATGNKPVQLQSEKDGLVFRDLWNAVLSGKNAIECEAVVHADAYRIRRLLLHWIDSRCLAVDK